MFRLLPALLLCLSLLSAACARQTYSVNTIDAPALTAHRTVAIMPFDVELDRLRLRDLSYAGPNPSAEDIARRQQQWTARQQLERRNLGYQLQQQLQLQLQAQQPSRGYTVQFQDVRETNTRLLQAGITYENLLDHSMEELQKALGVDAVLSGQTLLYQPMPNGLNLAARVLLNESLPADMPSNTATTNLTLHDCRSGRLTWRFDYERAGSASLNPERLSKDLVRAASPSFPYRRTE
jgi:hypothetical protein